MQQPQALAAEREGVLGWAFRRTGKCRVDLSEAESAVGKHRAQGRTFREAESELRPFVPDAPDLVEDRRGVRPVAQLFDVDVVPQDGDGSDGRLRKRIARASEHLAEVRCAVAPRVGHRCCSSAAPSFHRA